MCAGNFCGVRVLFSGAEESRDPPIMPLFLAVLRNNNKLNHEDISCIVFG